MNFVSWKHLIKTRKKDFGYRRYSENELNAIVYQIPVLPFLKILNHRRRDKILTKLSERYMNKYGIPDVCHVHGFYCAREAIRLKRKYGVPYVITEHYSVFARNMLNKKEIQRAGEAFTESSERIAVSHEFRQLLERMFHLDFTYLPNIVDVEKFSVSGESSENKKFTVLSVGSLDQNKNQQLLLNAFAQFPYPDSRLIIAGTGNKLQKLRQLSKEIGISDRTEFAGYVPHKELPVLYQQSDVLVVTSKYETFGIVMIEAMSSGIPVVSTPVGAAEQLLKDERLGCITDFSVDSVCQALIKIKTQNYDKNVIRTFAELNFSSNKVSQELKQIYKRVIDESGDQKK